VSFWGKKGSGSIDTIGGGKDSLLSSSHFSVNFWHLKCEGDSLYWGELKFGTVYLVSLTLSKQKLMKS
jgi:hypothetical protein